MRLAGLILLGLALLPLRVAAQSGRAPESVTVTGARSRAVLEAFVQSFAAPTRVTGKIARWAEGICPMTVGLRPGATRFVTRRVRDIAARVGAPVNGDAACRPNIEIVFTTRPQALANNIKRNQPGYLGYYDSQKQRDRLAAVTHPIQAWYTTATMDLRGKVEIDSGKTLGPGLDIHFCENAAECVMHLPNARADAVTGTRLGDGLRSNLYNVIIVADPTKLVDYEIGALSDYIAMLALTQMPSLDVCQPLPSIVNMLAQGCEKRTDALTENDAAFLNGLYRMGADRTLRTQQDEVAYRMEQDLAGHEKSEK